MESKQQGKDQRGERGEMVAGMMIAFGWRLVRPSGLPPAKKEEKIAVSHSRRSWKERTAWEQRRQSSL